MLGCARRFGAHRGRRGAEAYHGGRLPTVLLSASRSVDSMHRTENLPVLLDLFVGLLHYYLPGFLYSSLGWNPFLLDLQLDSGVLAASPSTSPLPRSKSKHTQLLTELWVDVDKHSLTACLVCFCLMITQRLIV